MKIEDFTQGMLVEDTYRNLFSVSKISKNSTELVLIHSRSKYFLAGMVQKYYKRDLQFLKPYVKTAH